MQNHDTDKSKIRWHRFHLKNNDDDDDDDDDECPITFDNRHPCLKDSCLNELTVHGLVDGVLVLSRLRSLVVHLSGLVGQPKLLFDLTKKFQIGIYKFYILTKKTIFPNYLLNFFYSINHTVKIFIPKYVLMRALHSSSSLSICVPPSKTTTAI